MNLRKTITAILIAFIASNVLTTIWYMFTNEANFVPYRRVEMNYVGMIFNHLVFASIFVYLFSFFYERKPKLARGFIYGILMGTMMFLPQAIVIRSIWEVDFNGIFILNSSAHLLIGGIIGLLVALIYNYKK